MLIHVDLRTHRQTKITHSYTPFRLWKQFGKLHHPSLTLLTTPDSQCGELMAFSMFNKEHELFPMVWSSN